MKEDKRDYVISDNKRYERDGSRNSKKEKRDIDGEFTHGKMQTTSRTIRRNEKRREYGDILRKWLRGQVGRKWDDVYSDFKVIQKSSGLYNVDINWYVELDSSVVDGKLINSKGEETYWWRSRDTLYVDKGILKSYKGRPRWRQSKDKEENPEAFWLDREKQIAAVKIDDVWYVAIYKWVKGLWRWDGYWEIVSKKTMNKKEKKKYGIDW